MATAKKITKENYLPTDGNNRFPVYSKQFNDLVDVVNELEPTDGTLVGNIISESTAGSGVTIDGVLLKDGGIALNSNVSEFTVLTTLTAATIVGTSAGTLGHANGVNIVTAPTSAFTLQFVSAVVIYDFATAAYTGGGDNTSIRIGSGGAAITGIVTSANLLGAAGDKIVRFEPLSTAALPMSVGVSISINSTTAWTQPGTAAGVVRIYTTYRIITTGL